MAPPGRLLAPELFDNMCPKGMDPTAFVTIALAGEHQYGPSSGVVIVNTDVCHAKFHKVCEVEPMSVRMHINEQLSNNPDNLYVLQKTTEHLHVFAYPRKIALQRLRDGTLPSLQPTSS